MVPLLHPPTTALRSGIRVTMGVFDSLAILKRRRCSFFPQIPRTNERLLQSNRTRRIKVVVQFLGDIVDHLLCFDAVTRLIQRRRKHGDGALAWGNCNNAASDTTLGW